MRLTAVSAKDVSSLNRLPTVPVGSIGRVSAKEFGAMVNWTDVIVAVIGLVGSFFAGHKVGKKRGGLSV